MVEVIHTVRIVLLVTVGIVAASMLVASGLSVGRAQEGNADLADVCALWSRAWDVSEGHCIHRVA